jgi:hypothetical protein
MLIKNSYKTLVVNSWKKPMWILKEKFKIYIGFDIHALYFSNVDK